MFYTLLSPSGVPPDHPSRGSPGILIEDQVSPKSCGHVRNKRVVSREEAVSRIRAAVDARWGPTRQLRG